MKRATYQHIIVVLTLALFTLSILSLGVVLSHAAPAGPHAYTPSPDGAPSAPQALPDLVLDEFTMIPSRPKVNEPVTITIQIRNAGADNAPGWRANLYVDPPDHPPTSTTPYSKTTLYNLTFPPAAVGELTLSGYTFKSAGCDHVLYAWADPRQGIPESDETNNMRAIHLCVDAYGIQAVPGADAYEPDDDCTNNAQSIRTDGTPQVRSFVPLTDTDYVKFDVVADGTYTITAAGTGQDADPNLEISDSCDFAPPFGTTTRMKFTAPQAGTYYIKLTNNATNPDPNKTTYQLTVQSDIQVTSGTTPIPLSISPTSGINSANINVVITGTQFAFPTMAELCTYEENVCTQHCTQLLATSWLGTEKLLGIVPPFNLAVTPPTLLTPGPYCLQLTNPGGKRGVLPNAYTVQPAAPTLLSLNPTQGYSDSPIDLHIYGFNFVSGLTLKFGMEPLDSADVRIVNSTHLWATLPAGQAPGIYDVSANYAAAPGATLAAAFTVLESAEDLYGTADELWRSPMTPRANQPVNLGLVVHRKGGFGPLRNVPVRFTVDGNLIGETTIALLAKNGQSSTPSVPFTPTQEGTYTVVATIDPDQTFNDTTRANNTVTRKVAVLVPTADGQAPHVDAFTINGEMTPTVTTRAVTLTAQASDDSGSVAQISYIEFEYNQGAGLWVPVQNSGWLNYTLHHQDYAWTLTPVGGLHYIQAWAKDADDNISEYPYQRRVDYMKPIEIVARNQARVYRRDLNVGETLDVVLKPHSGDPDLYIWPPDWSAGRPPWVSNQAGNVTEHLTFVAPVAGTYQIEVYGYTRAEYELTIQVSALARHVVLRPSVINRVKWPMTSPAVPLGAAPPLSNDVPASDPPTALDSVTISDIVSDTANATYVYTLTATATPANAVRPLLYRWEATNQAPITHTGYTTATFTWTATTWPVTTTARVVTVTVVNAANQVQTVITLDDVEKLKYIYLPLIIRQG